MLELLTKTRELNYAQDKFIFCKDEFICLKGTFGCGKSLAGLISARNECEQYPNNLYIIIRKEYIDLKNSTMRDWDDEFGDKYPIIGNEVKFPNGSILLFLHGEDINAIKNINAGGVLMVQAEEMVEDDLWFLKGRLRRKEGTRQLRIECNHDGHNWIYRLFNEQKIGTLITTNTFDNEKNLPPDYIPGLKKLPKRLQDRHLYGSDADMEGLVFDEFNFASNVIDPFIVPEEWNRIVVLDHGVTNPTAVAWGAINQDGIVFIYDEHYEAGKVISYHAAQIKQRDNSNVKDWLIDPSCNAKINSKNGQLYSVIDEYRDNGLFFTPADNAVLAGINRVNEYFKSGKCKIFKNCTHIIQDVSNWKWKALKPGIERNQPEQPEDKDDHGCDVVRYMIASRPSLTTIDNSPQPERKSSEWFKRMQREMQPKGLLTR